MIFRIVYDPACPGHPISSLSSIVGVIKFHASIPTIIAKSFVPASLAAYLPHTVPAEPMTTPVIAHFLNTTVPNAAFPEPALQKARADAQLPGTHA